jgi:CHAT domain-containing protein
VRAALTEQLRRAGAIRDKGDIRQAAEIFRLGYRKAGEQKEYLLQAHFLWGTANCHVAQHRYQEALDEYLQVREAFVAIKAPAKSLSAIDGSLSSLYALLGEYDAALEANQRAMKEDTSTEDSTGRRARHFIGFATALSQMGKPEEAKVLFEQAIAEAARFDDVELHSRTWDDLGSHLLMLHRLPEAEVALLEGFRIRKLNRLPSLGGSYRNLGLLRLEQGDVRSASTLLDASITELKSERSRIPTWRFYHARGRLRLHEGKLRAACDDFRLALELARDYRVTVPASDATRVSMEGLLHEVYASFVETGSRLYAETGSADLARETFEAIEENRAGSLAARLGERKEFRARLSPAYWDQLAELQSAEEAALRDGGETQLLAMRRLRGSLIELESKAGGASFRLRPGLLDRVRRSLDQDTALFSFHLAQTNSWLWAVDQSGLSQYRLPNQSEIATQSRGFRQAVLAGDGSAERLGRELYQSLFGALAPQYRNKSRWLLSLDEGLFELPFAALVAEGERNAPVYLIERHSIRNISSATLWAGGQGLRPMAGAFVAVGDAIYNTADGRWRGPVRDTSAGWLESFWGWNWKASAAAPANLGLSRLPGSGPEMAACAREWKSSSILLRGRNATKENVRRALETRPSVVHFATHILRRPEISSDAMIALSLSGSGVDQLLGPVEIGGWNADAGLVVLSGCSSGAAAFHPGAGPMGMTRAWLMAGARAVVSTGWPTSDDVGVFF